MFLFHFSFFFILIFLFIIDVPYFDEPHDIVFEGTASTSELDPKRTQGKKKNDIKLN